MSQGSHERERTYNTLKQLRWVNAENNATTRQQHNRRTIPANCGAVNGFVEIGTIAVDAMLCRVHYIRDARCCVSPFQRAKPQGTSIVSESCLALPCLFFWLAFTEESPITMMSKQQAQHGQ